MATKPAAATAASCSRRLVESSRQALSASLGAFLSSKFGVPLTATDVYPAVTRPKLVEHGDVAITCHALVQRLRPAADRVREVTGQELSALNLAEYLAREFQAANASLVSAQSDASGLLTALSAGSATVRAPLTHVAVTGAFVNATFAPSHFGRAITDAVFADFLQPPREAAAEIAEKVENVTEGKKDKVMIEYSQPNTHKAFHVGHMRNAALGDSLVRLYEQAGHEVVAVNYFGDEGAHVAKCLWFLQQIYLPLAQKAAAAGAGPAPFPSLPSASAATAAAAETATATASDADPAASATAASASASSEPLVLYPMRSLADLDAAVPAAVRAEWLGALYARAVETLDLGSYTALPWPMVVAAKVVAKSPHPDPEAPKNWHLCKVEVDAAGATADVVCGGTGYEVGDYVAYLPVGAKLTKKMGVIAPKDMRGVASCGVMLAHSELGGADADADGGDGPAASSAAAAPAASASASAGKKGGKKKGASADAAANSDKGIFVLNSFCPVAPGVPLSELGRRPEAFPPGSAAAAAPSVAAHVAALNGQAAAVLRALEHNEPEQVALWRRTGQWSLDEFHAIYKWLDCRFDHDFAESEVSAASQELVTKWLAQGLLETRDGAVVADLSADGLGTCVLRKSDGAGLYATKDLALAARKFEAFGVDKSIYVVDAAQTYHFQQVFKVLSRAGFVQAAKCVHVPYGLVVLPSGRMSSRKGNVLLFSQLKREMERVLNEKFNKNNTLSDESVRRIAVASIKYGMLNRDTAKDIVFELDQWTNNTGNTGPYLMYALARINSILVARDEYDGPKFDLMRTLTGLAPAGSDSAALAAALRAWVDPETQRFDLIGWAATATPREAADASPTLAAALASAAAPLAAESAAVASAAAARAFLDAVDFDKYLTEPSERLVVLQLNRFWDAVDAAVAGNSPSPVCDYAFHLAQAFSTWYEQVRLVQTVPAALPTKIVFIKAVAATLETTMRGLGITPVERM